jgi:hypothetical protein
VTRPRPSSSVLSFSWYSSVLVDATSHPQARLEPETRRGHADPAPARGDETEGRHRESGRQLPAHRSLTRSVSAPRRRIGMWVALLLSHWCTSSRVCVCSRSLNLAAREQRGDGLVRLDPPVVIGHLIRSCVHWSTESLIDIHRAVTRRTVSLVLSTSIMLSRSTDPESIPAASKGRLSDCCGKLLRTTVSGGPNDRFERVEVDVPP